MSNSAIGSKTWWWRIFYAIFPHDEDGRYRLSILIFRFIALTNLVAGFLYVGWRWTSSLNPNALWFAIPLILAETYSYIGTIMFVVTMWKPSRRVSPPPIDGATVDVYIATYNEPVDMVRLTVEAAMRITWPNTKVYVLDDGARPAMEAVAREIGCGYIVRGEEWSKKARHAKAGNINNALLHTSGEFILLLDADQIPAPEIVERIIGYFRDEKLAFAQTPQYFYNVHPGDPFSSNAPLFYGPILQGMDGWGAGFLCGSNALLRREALMQLGISGYVQEMEERVEHALSQMGRDLRKAQGDTLAQRIALASLGEALVKARQALKDGQPLEIVGDIVRKAVVSGQKDIAQEDLSSIIADLQAMGTAGDEEASGASQVIVEQLSEIVQEMADAAPVCPDTVGLSSEAMADLELTRSDEAIPIGAFATISVTEDLATAMRLHAMGWHSVFHTEILAYGLAPEDLGSAMLQRLRWAQGTLQVLVRENPFRVKGLTFPQRLQYFSTMYSYFSGFSSLIYLMSPIICLLTTISPVSAWTTEFLWRLVPYYLINRLMFKYVAWGMETQRAEQFGIGLFSLWIQAIVTVFTGANLKFAVTPKERQTGTHLRLVWPQLTIIGLTLLAVAYGWLSVALGWMVDEGGVIANTFWGLYNTAMLVPIVKAAVYVPPSGWEPRPPEFLFPDSQADGPSAA